MDYITATQEMGLVRRCDVGMETLVNSPLNKGVTFKIKYIIKKLVGVDQLIGARDVCIWRQRSGDKQKMERPTCQRSITIPEGGVNAVPQNLDLGFEVEVAGYMSKIGSGGENSCDACIDGGKDVGLYRVPG